MKYGIIGAGSTGKAAAAWLHQAGCPALVWDRSPRKRADLAQSGLLATGKVEGQLPVETADTLEELVAKIYPDDTAAQQTALESIQRYNQLAKDGYDEDFHKPASRMWALENGPFYADKFTTALLLVCIGGLESDENCHAFDADRNVIPGLYVAGNIQGNRFATEYPIGLKGVSHSMAMYYGYVAGKNAMQEI